MSDMKPGLKHKVLNSRPIRMTVFLLLAALLLAFDLGVKSWSFAHVAERPIRLQPPTEADLAIWPEMDLRVEAQDEDGEWQPVDTLAWPVFDREDATSGPVTLPDGEVMLIHSGLQRNNPPVVRKVVVPHVLNLSLVLNRGALFGLGSGQRMPLLALGVLAVVCMGIALWRFRIGRLLPPLALSCVLSGAIGNIYDRFMFGAVRDMLHMLPGVKLPFGWQYPGFIGGSREIYPWVFNIADVLLLVGIALFLLSGFFDAREEKRVRLAAGGAAPENSDRSAVAPAD